MVDPDLFARYSSALSVNANMAEQAVKKLMSALSSSMELSTVRDILKAEYPIICEQYGNRAAAVALEYYTESRTLASVSQEYEAAMPSAPAATLFIDDVGYHMGMQYAGLATLVDLESALTKIASRHTMERADETLYFNARNDPAHPKWAFVPHLGACGWCVLIGSQGFWYRSERTTTSLRHNSCLCSVVVDFDVKNPHLDGYDPAGMAKRYQKCLDALGGRSALWDEFQKLSPEQKSLYGRKERSSKRLSRDIAASIGYKTNAFDDYVTKKTLHEMNLRDRRWLYDGTPPKCEIADRARPTPSEKSLAKTLSKDGWKSLFRATRSKEGKRTSDVFFVSGKKGTLGMTPWEFKQPIGSGKQTLSHQFEETAGQAHNIVIDVQNLTGKWNQHAIEKEIQQKLNRGYTVKKGKLKGSSWQFDRAIVINADGSMSYFFSQRK